MENILFYFTFAKWGIFSGLLFGFALSFTAPILILNKNALFPHALTHVLFLAIVLAISLDTFIPKGFNYFFIIGVTLLAMSGILFLKYILSVYEDTATSIIAQIAMGIALIITAKTSQYNAQLLSYLFGSLLTVTKNDFWKSLIIALITLVGFCKFKSLWISQTIEKEIPGMNFKYSNLVFLIIITLQILIGIKLMGILLISTFFVLSSCIALKLASNFNQVILLCFILNILGILGGSLISVWWDVPFSGAVVIFMSLYLVLPILKALKKYETD